MHLLSTLVNRTVDNDMDTEAVMAIIEKFSPLINKLARKLEFYGRSDLIIEILNVLKNFNKEKLRNFESEGQLFNYFKVSIINRYIKLLKQDFKYVFNFASIKV